MQHKTQFFMAFKGSNAWLINTFWTNIIPIEVGYFSNLALFEENWALKVNSRCAD